VRDLRGCKDLYERVVNGYIEWSWVLPDIAADAKHSPECSGVDEGDPGLVRPACFMLGCPEPFKPLAGSFSEFANAYSQCATGCTPPLADELKTKTKIFFQLSRRMGCATLVAAYRGAARPDYDDTTGYCDEDFRDLRDYELSDAAVHIEQDQLRTDAGAAWCNVALKPAERSDASENGIPDLRWDELFAVTPVPDASDAGTQVEDGGGSDAARP
jgi:hypothetical protein